MSSKPPLELIEKELAMAREAIKQGNEGKARVCARRAAGWAIAWYIAHRAHPDWPQDALGQLRRLKDETSFSEEARGAAARLSAKVAEDSHYSTDPLDDAAIIVTEIARLSDPLADF